MKQRCLNAWFNRKLEKLDVISTGTIPPDPLQFLSSHRLASALTVLRQKYDRIIVDSPPISAGQRCGCVVNPCRLRGVHGQVGCHVGPTGFGKGLEQLQTGQRTDYRHRPESTGPAQGQEIR